MKLPKPSVVFELFGQSTLMQSRESVRQHTHQLCHEPSYLVPQLYLQYEEKLHCSSTSSPSFLTCKLFLLEFLTNLLTSQNNLQMFSEETH